MGGFNGFEDLNASQVVSIREYSRKFWECNRRAPLVAMDMGHHIMQVSTEGKSRNEGIAHLLIFKRLAAYLKVGCNIVCVFDGPLADPKRRHTRTAQVSAMRQFGPMALYTKNLCNSLGLCSLEAPNEGEALCAWLQKNGYVDIVFSGDADVLANGATNIMRLCPPGHLQSKAGSTNADERLVQIYMLDRQKAPQFALMALILGNDWEEGVSKLGKKVAIALADPKTGLVPRLESIALMEPGIERDMLRKQWHDEVKVEVNTNKSKWLSKKVNCDLPEEFPSLKMFLKMLNPAAEYDAVVIRNIVNKCNEAKRITDVHSLSRRRNLLWELWNQVRPGFRSKSQNFSEVSEEKIEKGFKSTLGSIVLTNLMVSDSELTKSMEFKEVKKETEIEVVKGAFIGPNLEEEFLVGIKVPRFLFNLNSHAKVIPKANKKISASERISATNFKITEFFSASSSKPSPGNPTTTPSITSGSTISNVSMFTNENHNTTPPASHETSDSVSAVKYDSIHLLSDKSDGDTDVDGETTAPVGLIRKIGDFASETPNAKRLCSFDDPIPSIAKSKFRSFTSKDSSIYDSLEDTSHASSNSLSRSSSELEPAPVPTLHMSQNFEPHESEIIDLIDSTEDCINLSADDTLTIENSQNTGDSESDLDCVIVSVNAHPVLS